MYLRILKKVPWLMVLLACTAEAEKSVTLSVGHWPPYIDQSTPGEGRLSRIVLDIYQEAGIDSRLTFQSWNSVIEEHLKKPHHLSFGWVKNDERQQKWHYSNPIIDTKTGLWVRSDFDQIISDYADLEPYLIGVSELTSYGQGFEENKNRFRRAEFVKPGQGFRMLIEGRIDAMIGHYWLGKYYLSRHKDWKERVYFLETPIFPTIPLYMVCEKKNRNCLAHIEQFNQALKAYRRSH